MASELKVNKITPESGLTLTLGDSGDTINFGSGVLPNFENLTVTGDLTVDTNSLKVDSTNNFVGIGTASPTVALDVVGAITATGNITGTLATAAQPNITSLGTLTGLTTTGDINFGDNDKAVFGAGSDLQIYHNSANGKSYIEESGTGNLVIRGTDIDILSGDGEAMVTAIANGAVSLYYDASTYATPKLATTSTGIDVTGTANADIVNIYNASAQGRLNVSNNGAEQLEVFPGDVAGKVSLQAFNRSDTTYDSFRYIGLTHEFLISGTEKMRIDSSGNVGIGTSSPATDFGKVLHISGASAATATTGGSRLFYTGTNSSGNWGVYDGTAGAYRAVINSSGNVGIGTSSPSVDLHIHTSASSASSEILLTNGDTGSTATDGFKIALNTGAGGEIWNYENDYIRFGTNNTERMRIDSSGNVGIGTSSPATELHVKSSDNRMQITIENDAAQGAIRMEGINPVDGSDNLQITASTSGTNRGIYFTTSDSGLASGKILFASNGNVGIGTTSPSTALDVSGTVTATAFSGDGSALTGVGGGITVADQFRLTSSFTGDAVPISSNLSRVSGTGAGGGIGSAMSVSSGVFTFPETGVYLVSFNIRANNSADSGFLEGKIRVTTNNSTYSDIATCRTSGGTGSEDSAGCSILLDVTSTSNTKVKFDIEQSNNSNSTQGDANANLTYMTFIRLGDT